MNPRGAVLLFSLLAVLRPIFAAPPVVGEKAPDFTLSTPEGKAVRLSDEVAKGPVALIVLRGFPGYQCPYCNRQTQDLLQSSNNFAKAGIRVLLVYPGPPQDLGGKANDFLRGKQLPEHFHLVLDPAYQVTNAYGLRWNAPRETAYPSTFLIDSQGLIFFSKIVKLHGGRATAVEILDAMPKPKDRP
jgi:thioredoxin-dependent peroxiredoxin